MLLTGPVHNLQVHPACLAPEQWDWAPAGSITARGCSCTSMLGRYLQARPGWSWSQQLPSSTTSSRAQGAKCGLSGVSFASPDSRRTTMCSKALVSMPRGQIYRPAKQIMSAQTLSADRGCLMEGQAAFCKEVPQRHPPAPSVAAFSIDFLPLASYW